MNNHYIIKVLIDGMKSAQSYARSRSAFNALLYLEAGNVFNNVWERDNDR